MTDNTLAMAKTKAAKWATRIFLLAVALVMFYPLLWNLLSSFKTNTEFLEDAFSLPSHLEWSNYGRALEKSKLLANIWNSFYVVGISVAVLVICVIPCSYCLVRYKFFGSRQILGMYMAAIFIQATYIMIPLFLQSGFMSSIPKDYEEAARLDGCGNFGVLRHVVVPMARPGIITVCMITAMSAWNEYPVALVMLTKPELKTMPVGLAALYEQQRYATDWGALFAALMLALIPTIMLFIIGQKQLLQGTNVGGIKG